MTKYEYTKHLTQHQSDLVNEDADMLQEMGDKGWRLVQIIKEPTGYYTKYEYYFIREK